jgi:large subunit ribosomal protein L29
MSLPSIRELETLDDNALDRKIIETKKEIFDLRLKKATFTSLEPHLFKKAKRVLAQLLTLKTQRQLKE